LQIQPPEFLKPLNISVISLGITANCRLQAWYRLTAMRYTVLPGGGNVKLAQKEQQALQEFQLKVETS
jgi:hypothetical protein